MTIVPSDGPEAFLEFHNTIRFIRLQWIDYSGILRARIVTKSNAIHLMRGDQDYSVPQACMQMPLSGTAALSSRKQDVWKLIPGWDSLKLCGFRKSHGAVMCFVKYMSLEDPNCVCPRHSLKPAMERFERFYHQQKLLDGFEIEFSIHQASKAFVRPCDRTVKHSMLSGLRGQILDIMEETTTALEASEIEVCHFHVEGADQYEISLAPLPPMQAIDALYMAQETLRTVFMQHDLKVSMTPKPDIGDSLHGLHAHLSINPGVSTSSSFLGGVLQHLRTLCAFGMPSFDSYARVRRLCVGDWAGYGTGNRDLPIRKIHEHRWELRLLDATANVYLFLAVVLAAGLDGIDQNTQPIQRDCDAFLADLTADEAIRRVEGYGITGRLPRSLLESLDVLRDDSEVASWIGVELIEAYLRTKDQHQEVFSKLTDEERLTLFLDFF